MDRLAEILAILEDAEALSRLTDAELTAMREELAALYASIRAGEVDGTDPLDTDVLSSIATALAACRDEDASRVEDRAAAEARVAEIDALAYGTEGAPAVEETPEELAAREAAEAEAAAAAAAAEGADPPADGTPPADATPPADGEPVVASGAPAGRPSLPSLREVNARQPRVRVPVEDVLSGTEDRGMIRFAPTGELVSYRDLLDRIGAYGDSVSGGVPMGQKVVLGQVPTLAEGAPRINSRTDSPEVIARKLDEAVSGALDPANWGPGGVPSEALLASGGWGTPSPVVYDVETIAVADRPVRAALPSVGVDRGGLTWVVQPKFSDIVTGGPTTTTAAVGIWTALTDASPGNTVKSHQTVGSPTTRTVQLDALYMALQEGVLQSRAFPEWIAAWERNTEAAWARMAETFLLDKIEASSLVKHVSQANILGTARDYLAFLIQLCAAERNRQRMRPDAQIRILYPSLLLDMVQIDLLRSGTNFVDASPLVVARTWVDSQLAAANINGSAYIDSSTNGAQLAAAQADQHSLNGLLTTVRTYVYPEGTFVVGDGGNLDLGIVRDADLVNTNDFRTFSESFEAIFDRGQWAYILDTVLCSNGAASAAVDIQHLCTTGS